MDETCLCKAVTVLIFLYTIKLATSDVNTIQNNETNYGITSKITVGSSGSPHYNYDVFEEDIEKNSKSARNLETAKLLPDILTDLLFPKYDFRIPNSTYSPTFLNIININVINENAVKTYPKKHRKQERLWKNIGAIDDNKKLKENLFIHPNNSDKSDSEKVGNIFERIKLRMALKRNKRNIENQKHNIKNVESSNSTYENIQEEFEEKLPKITILNNEEIDVSKWLKNWRDILAVNPVLRTEKPTKPAVMYIDEWKYSYRVTLYDSGTYNISNFICSGILVASQWVLTSAFCNLKENVDILIGVHTLPKNISHHNRYYVQKQVYSLSENLVLIQMDRPVQWNFVAPDIGSMKLKEIKNLLRLGKCRILSWVPVEIENNIFELREYPQLRARINKNDKEKLSQNSLDIVPHENYGLCNKEFGSPILCDGVVTGLLLNAEEDCRSNMTMELLCPVLEWITFFTKEDAYFEVTARKITPNNLALKNTLPYIDLMCILLAYYVMY